MKRNSFITFLAFLLLLCALSTSAFAIDESEVESAIAASGKDAVAGNVFICFYARSVFLRSVKKLIALWLPWESMLEEPAEACWANSWSPVAALLPLRVR